MSKHVTLSLHNYLLLLGFEENLEEQQFDTGSYKHKEFPLLSFHTTKWMSSFEYSYRISLVLNESEDEDANTTVGVWTDTASNRRPSIKDFKAVYAQLEAVMLKNKIDRKGKLAHMKMQEEQETRCGVLLKFKSSTVQTTEVKEERAVEV